MFYAFGEWELDVERYELRRGDQPIKLEPQVFSVLAYLVHHHDRVLSKQELLSHLWPDQFIGDSALERCIMAARKAVGDSGGKQQVIKTFHRRGYRFVAPVAEHSPAIDGALAATGSSSLPPNGQYGSAETNKPLAPPRAADAARGNPMSDGDRFIHHQNDHDHHVAPHPAPAHRQVTVLSCAIANLRGRLEADSSGALPSSLKPLFDRIAVHVQSHDGMMALSHDDGFLALFGASAPCDDHALRAVVAAMALQKQLVQAPSPEGLPMPLELCIGLHTGDIIGKRFGDDPQMIYMAVGNTLQFAANLQACTPPGMILASEATYRLVQHMVCGEVAGLVSLQSGLRHTAAYHLSHLLTPSGPSPYASRPVPTVTD